MAYLYTIFCNGCYKSIFNDIPKIYTRFCHIMFIVDIIYFCAD